MLILTRTPHERIFINGQEIIVEVLSFYGDKVRFGITAPPEVAIDHPKKYRYPHPNDD